MFITSDFPLYISYETIIFSDNYTEVISWPIYLKFSLTNGFFHNLNKILWFIKNHELNTNLNLTMPTANYYSEICLNRTLNKPKFCINQTENEVSLLIQPAYKPNTCLFRTVLVPSPRQFSLDRFHCIK